MYGDNLIWMDIQVDNSLVWLDIRGQLLDLEECPARRNTLIWMDILGQLFDLEG